jgi:hypothetical protein
MEADRRPAARIGLYLARSHDLVRRNRDGVDERAGDGLALAGVGHLEAGGDGVTPVLDPASLNWICETIRRFGSETAVIEIAPPTPTGVGDGVGVPPAVTTSGVSEFAVVDPTRVFAMTWTRIVLSLSPERTP